MSYANNLRRENRIFQDELRVTIGDELGEFRARLHALESRIAAAPLPAPEPLPADSIELGPGRDLSKGVAYVDERGNERWLKPGEFLRHHGAAPPPKTTLTDLELRLALRECGHDFEDGSGLNVATSGKQELPNSLRFYRRFRERFHHYAPAGDPDKALREMHWRGVCRRDVLGRRIWLQPGDAEFDRMVAEPSTLEAE